MGPFLRWGIFGILAVAALIYAYNASKSLAEQRQAASQAAAAPAAESPANGEAAPGIETADDTAAVTVKRDTGMPEHCEVELFVAMRALDARRNGDPLDRLLRIQEIAFVEDEAVRQRRTDVATRWYSLEGEPPPFESLIDRVVSDCRSFKPGP